MKYVVEWKYEYNSGVTDSGNRIFVNRSEAIEFFKDMVDEAQTDDAINPAVALYCNGKVIASYINYIGDYMMWTDRIYSGKYGVRFAD